MIRGLFIFFSSLILLSATQIKLSWIENETIIQTNESLEIFAADLLTYESIEHPGQLGDIRLLKQKTSKIRTTNNTLWFVSTVNSNHNFYNTFFTKAQTLIYKYGKTPDTGPLPLYLAFNKLII